MGGNVHVSAKFGRLLALYRKPDGSEWGGQDLEDATGGVVSRSYVSNLKNSRIDNPGLAKLEAIAVAIGFPPALWFGEEGGRVADEAIVGAVGEKAIMEIVEEAVKLGPRDRQLLLGIARQFNT